MPRVHGLEATKHRRRNGCGGGIIKGGGPSGVGGIICSLSTPASSFARRAPAALAMEDDSMSFHTTATAMTPPLSLREVGDGSTQRHPKISDQQEQSDDHGVDEDEVPGTQNPNFPTASRSASIVRRNGDSDRLQGHSRNLISSSTSSSAELFTAAAGPMTTSSSSTSTSSSGRDAATTPKEVNHNADPSCNFTTLNNNSNIRNNNNSSGGGNSFQDGSKKSNYANDRDNNDMEYKDGMDDDDYTDNNNGCNTNTTSNNNNNSNSNNNNNDDGSALLFSTATSNNDDDNNDNDEEQSVDLLEKSDDYDILPRTAITTSNNNNNLIMMKMSSQQQQQKQSSSSSSSPITSPATQTLDRLSMIGSQDGGVELCVQLDANAVSQPLRLEDKEEEEDKEKTGDQEEEEDEEGEDKSPSTTTLVTTKQQCIQNLKEYFMSTQNSAKYAERRKQSQNQLPQVTFCHHCNNNNNNSSLSKLPLLPHHGLCPKHEDFFVSGSYEILNLIVDGNILGCNACIYHFDHGRPNKMLSHLENCKRYKGSKTAGKKVIGGGGRGGGNKSQQVASSSSSGGREGIVTTSLSQSSTSFNDVVKQTDFRSNDDRDKRASADEAGESQEGDIIEKQFNRSSSSKSNNNSNNSKNNNTNYSCGNGKQESPELSDYEKLRLRNIQRNEARLAELGLLVPPSNKNSSGSSKEGGGFLSRSGDLNEGTKKQKQQQQQQQQQSKDVQKRTQPKRHAQMNGDDVGGSFNDKENSCNVEASSFAPESSSLIEAAKSGCRKCTLEWQTDTKDPMQSHDVFCPRSNSSSRSTNAQKQQSNELECKSDEELMQMLNEGVELGGDWNQIAKALGRRGFLAAARSEDIQKLSIESGGVSKAQIMDWMNASETFKRYEQLVRTKWSEKHFRIVQMNDALTEVGYSRFGSGTGTRWALPKNIAPRVQPKGSRNKSSSSQTTPPPDKSRMIVQKRPPSQVTPRLSPALQEARHITTAITMGNTSSNISQVGRSVVGDESCSLFQSALQKGFSTTFLRGKTDEELRALLHSSSRDSQKLLQENVLPPLIRDFITEADRNSEIPAPRGTKWLPCPNPWGKIGHEEGDFVVISPFQSASTADVVAVYHQGPNRSIPKRFVAFPLEEGSPYHATHRSPERGGYSVLRLTRDRMGLRPWGFTVRLHEFGGACLVDSIEPLSPAEAAEDISGFHTKDTPSGLQLHDMIICVNGKCVGCMTETELQIDLDVCGSEMMLVVARFDIKGNSNQEVTLEDLAMDWNDIGAGAPSRKKIVCFEENIELLNEFDKQPNVVTKALTGTNTFSEVYKSVRNESDSDDEENEGDVDDADDTEDASSLHWTQLKLDSKASYDNKKKPTCNDDTKHRTMSELESKTDEELMQMLNEVIESGEWLGMGRQIAMALARRAFLAAARDEHIQTLYNELGGVSKAQIMDWMNASETFKRYEQMVRTKWADNTLEQRMAEALTEVGYSRFGGGTSTRWALPKTIAPRVDVKKLQSITSAGMRKVLSGRLGHHSDEVFPDDDDEKRRRCKEVAKTAHSNDLESKSDEELMQMLNEVIESGEWLGMGSQIAKALARRAFLAAARDEHIQTLYNELGGVSKAQIMDWMNASETFKRYEQMVRTKWADNTLEQRMAEALTEVGYSRFGGGASTRWALPKTIAPRVDVKKLQSITSAGKRKLESHSCVQHKKQFNQHSDSDGSSPSSSDGEEDDDDNPWLGCVCGRTHPSPIQVFWIQCGACDAWHNVAVDCVGFTEETADTMEDWFCWSCHPPVAGMGL